MPVRSHISRFTALLAAGLCAALACAQAAAPAAPPPAPVPAPVPAAKPATQGVLRHGIAEPIAKPAGAIRIASYNIENLFDAGADGKMGDQPASRGTEPKPDDHRAAVAKAIRAVNADILALQEIQNLEALTRFRDTYLKDMGYDHIASLDAGDDRGIEQSVLSRFPITQTRQWVNLPLGGTHNADRTESDRVPGGPILFKRSPLMTTIELPRPADAPADAKPQTITLFNVHFKSGGRRDAYWREREATKTAELASQVKRDDPSTAVIILGDFNAQPRDRAFRNVAAAGFADAFADLPDGDSRYITHASDRVIDHLMLCARAEAGLIKETRFVLGTMQRPAGVDWRTTEPPEGYASDHYPVVIDLDPVRLLAAPAEKLAPAPAAAPAPSPALAPAPAGTAP
jgi:endonuclease/exonuclease/phosphatase family metal-dependent hydrolase